MAGNIEQMLTGMVEELRNLRTALNQQQDDFQQFSNSAKAENETLRTTLDDLKNQQTTVPDEPPTLSVNTSTAAANNEPLPSRVRPKHPDPEHFSGENPQDYLPFRMNLRTKFEVDRATFSSSSEQTYYAYSRLKGKASQRMLPWLQAKQDQQQPILLDDFLRAMDNAFKDADYARKALIHVHTMKQGKKDLEEFLSEFDGALLHAGGMGWSDIQKIALLDTAINARLLGHLIGRKQPNTYEGYCAKLRRINQDVRRLEGSGSKSQMYSQPNQVVNPPRADPDKMDWESTHAQLAALRTELSTLKTPQKTNHGPRARWASTKELASRKSLGQCLRCGSKDHFVRQCDKRPAQKPAQLAAVETPTSQATNDPNTDSEESEKE